MLFTVVSHFRAGLCEGCPPIIFETNGFGTSLASAVMALASGKDCVNRAAARSASRWVLKVCCG
jgi:hypothetical protein